MKILLSAYSCRPGCGSELGVGWRWASELAKQDHYVYLLTRTIFRPYMEQELSERPLANLHVVYYDPLPWLNPTTIGIYAHYYLWQIGVYFFSRKICADNNFDLVQHITLGVFRQPSLLGFLRVPFVFGPVGGGESAPLALRRDFPVRGKMIDLLRGAVNRLANFDPLLRFLYKRASLILCKTEDTQNIIPLKYRHKAVVKREIGIDGGNEIDLVPKRSGKRKEPLRVLYVGRLLYWKGLHLGLEAFSRLLKDYPEAEFTVIGVGPDEKWLRDKSGEFGIDANTRWLGKVDHSELLHQYADYDVFLFPSLHDSSGNVVLEAMSAGLPVICLDLGGPPTMVDETCGVVVPARGMTQEEVVEGLCNALLHFSEDNDYLNRSSFGAITKVKSMSWRATVADAYSEINARIFCKSSSLK